MFGASEKGIKNEKEIEREVETKKKRQKKMKFYQMFGKWSRCVQWEYRMRYKDLRKMREKKRKEKNDR